MDSLGYDCDVGFTNNTYDVAFNVITPSFGVILDSHMTSWGSLRTLW